MNQQLETPSSTTGSKTEPQLHLPHCRHLTASGRHCRSTAADLTSGLCPRHALSPAYRHSSPSLAADLLGDLTAFQSAAAVNEFLSRLLLLLARDRVSPRRAAVMIYACNQILRSLHSIHLENKIAGDAPPEIILDLPRPKREDDPITNSIPGGPNHVS